MNSHREVVVIGGGQAGLSIGYHLARQGRDFVILEAASGPAAAWRSRWDSLKLFTPARYDGLPGRPFPADPDSYPSRDEVVAYLTDYARDFEQPVELNSAVRTVRGTEDGYVIELDDRTYVADKVVVATGPFQTPRVPASLAQKLGRDVMQLHSSEYRRPEAVPTGCVLVVGGGNSGYQIAEDPPPIPPGRCTCASDRGRRRFRHGSWGVSSSAFWIRPGSCTSPSARGSASGSAIATR
jgi:putative flavoprotein involved in K+ transport